MTNIVKLDGYITDASAIRSFKPNVNTEFTLNVPKGGDSKEFNYIPVATNGYTPQNGSLDDCLTNKIHVEGKLVTYPDNYGSQCWHVVANSIKLIIPNYNPFAPRNYNPFAKAKQNKKKSSDKSKKQKKPNKSKSKK